VVFALLLLPSAAIAEVGATPSSQSTPAASVVAARISMQGREPLPVVPVA